MSDNRRYGDDPSRYPYSGNPSSSSDYYGNPSSSSDYFGNPSSSSDYFGNPSSSYDVVNDPGMSSGYNNNPYFGTSTYPNQPLPNFDNNSYSGNPSWGSAYSNQPTRTSPIPDSGILTKSDHNLNAGYATGYAPQPGKTDKHFTVYPDDTTSSDVDSDDSADSHVHRGFGLQGFGTSAGLQRCSASAQASDADSEVRSFSLQSLRAGLQSCSTSALAKKKRKNKKHQQWIASWKKGTAPPPEFMDGNCVMNYSVSTDGYFRAGRKGGCGVIIRDNVGKPIVASAVSSPKVVSFLYHQLQGVTRAVELAVDYSLRDIQLFCNAKHVARLVNKVFDTVDGCSFHTTSSDVDSDDFCKSCVRACAKEEYHAVLPLLKKLARLASKFFVPLQIGKVPRERNRAADYLAKNGGPGMEVLHPDEFPDELKEILCEDYVESEKYKLPCSG
ncbi:hypothetical protein MKW94_004528 [Papaver nudicaule]|uniref:Uncharacterized protein n=1 Tax=Papaver nudicaule TaxID=74823 RepID=A0AA41VQG1_PAPNU|nr:hypothetical protein [Papaver nudicaule]